MNDIDLVEMLLRALDFAARMKVLDVAPSAARQHAWDYLAARRAAEASPRYYR